MHEIASYQDQVTVFLHEWRVIRDAPEWHHVREARREFEQIVQSILEQGEREGVFDVRETRLTVLAFLGMINYSYTWYSAKGPHTAEEIADHFAADLHQGHRPLADHWRALLLAQERSERRQLERRANRKPWPRRHPSARSASRCSGSSIPSATRFSSRLWASSMMPRTSRESAWGSASPLTNGRATLSPWTGRRWRWLSEE